MTVSKAFELIRNGQVLDSDSKHVFLNKNGDYFFLISEFHHNDYYFHELWPGFELYLDYNNMNVIIPEDVNKLLYGWIREKQLQPKKPFNIFNTF